MKKISNIEDCEKLFNESPISPQKISTKGKNFSIEFGQVSHSDLTKLSEFTYGNLENDSKFIKTPLPEAKKKFSLILIIKKLFS